MDSMLILIRYMLKFLPVNCADHEQTPLFASSNLGLHFMPTSKKMDCMLILDYVLYHN